MIREITANDIEQCVKVIRDSFKTVADEFGITKENAPYYVAYATNEERLKGQFFEEKRPMYAYFKDGRIVGYYSLALLDNHECEMNNLCVLPEYRHGSIGKELLENAGEVARSLGCVKMNIGIVEENKVLRKWYEQNGFVHTGTKKYDYFPFTCGYMHKEL